jgi:hypothetical protein
MFQECDFWILHIKLPLRVHDEKNLRGGGPCCGLNFELVPCSFFTGTMLRKINDCELQKYI